MSQTPFGGPQAQNPPYPPYQQPAPPHGPPPGSYGPPPMPYGGQPQYGPVSVAPQQGPGFGWGPSFGPPGGPGGGPGFQPGWQPQRPKKKSKGPAVLVLGLLALAVAGLFVWNQVGKGTDDDYTPPVSSGRYTPSPTTTSEPTSGPTNEPTSEPTSTTTEAPEPQAIDVVAKNRLYRAGRMAATNCREPSVRPTNNRNAAAYWAAIKPCLDRGWAPLVAKAGYKFVPPRMTYWAGTSTSTPCGNGPVSVPFYCPSNQMMYMKVDVFVRTYLEYPDAESKAYSRMWYSRSIAHEYGHHVQELTGILEAAHDLEYDAASYADRLRMNRRTELQANCFAGVFLSVNRRSYPINGLMLQVWNKWVVTAGDKPNEGTHGSRASQARFMGQSFRTGNPATCNTFTASPSNVS